MTETDMGNNITRRDALKRMALSIGGIIISPNILMGGDKNVFDRIFPKDNIVWDEDSFYIKRVIKVLKAIDFSFNKEANSKEKTFTCYSIVSPKNTRKCASLKIKRDADRMLIKLIRKGSYGYSQFLSVDEHLTNESDLISWNYSLSFSNAEDNKPFIGNRISGSGSLLNNHIRINENDCLKDYKTSTGRVMISWNSFDFIEKIAKDGNAVSCDFIDECDMYSGVRTFSPFKKAKVSLKCEQHNLYSWTLTGQGTIPVFYWLDEHSDLLFVNSGMNVFVRN